MRASYVVLAGLLAASAGVALAPGLRGSATSGAASRGSPGAVPNGIAIAYEAPPFRNDFTVAGRLSLDRIASNRSWYCDWFMLVALRRDRADQPFVQAGLIRWAKNGFRLSAFVASARGNQPLRFDDLGALPDGPHDVVMRATRGTMAVEIDGKRLRTFSLARLFAKNERVYAQLAAEVKEPGDAVRAALRGVAIAHDGGTPQPYRGRCRHDDRGLRIATAGDELRATGRFDPAQPERFAGCTGFFARERSDGARASPRRSR